MTKTGKAYKGRFVSGFALKVFKEGYLKPWKRNYIQVCTTGWNIVTSIAPRLGVTTLLLIQTILTVIPYVSLNNLLKSYTDAAKTEAIYTGSKLVVGIKVGIRIYS